MFAEVTSSKIYILSPHITTTSPSQVPLRPLHSTSPTTNHQSLYFANSAHPSYPAFSTTIKPVQFPLTLTLTLTLPSQPPQNHQPTTPPPPTTLSKWATSAPNPPTNPTTPSPTRAAPSPPPPPPTPPRPRPLLTHAPTSPRTQAARSAAVAAAPQQQRAPPPPPTTTTKITTMRHGAQRLEQRRYSPPLSSALSPSRSLSCMFVRSFVRPFVWSFRFELAYIYYNPCTPGNKT